MRSPFAIPCLTLAVLLSTSAATSAAAPCAYEVVTRTVKFDDLNLNNRDDVATLYARIKAAANEVCEPLDSRSIDTFLHVRRCKEQAISRAVTDAQSSVLETFHMAATNQLDSVLSR
jgi:UrcA family protein